MCFNEEGKKRRARSLIVAVMAIILLGGLARSGLCEEQVTWKAKFEAKVKELRDAGQPITFEEVLARRERIPDDQNSALILLEAFQHLQPRGSKHDLSCVLSLSWVSKPGVRHSDELREMMRRCLEAHAEALRLIHQGAKLPHGGYPIALVKNPFEIELPHLDLIRQGARLCGVEAGLHACNSEGKPAADSVIVIRRLAASLGDGPFLIDVLVRISVDAIAVAALQRSLALCEMPADSMASLRREMASAEGELSFELALFAERSAAHYYFTEASVDELRDLLLEPPNVFSRFLTAGAQRRSRDALFYYDLMDQAMRINAMPEGRKLKEARRWADELEQKIDERRDQFLVTAGIMPSVPKVFEREARGKARLRVARTALALEEWRMAHAHWPDSLEQLVPDFLEAVPEDPFSEGTLIYRKTQNGVVVYSVGPDGKDDKGVSRDEAERKAGDYVTEGWDISFRLLDPERRGAETMTFRQEVINSRLSPESLGKAGLTEARLRELGLTDEDLERLRAR